MYNKIIRLPILVLCIFFSFIISVDAEDYTLNDLIEKGKELNGKQVVISGEAIGEPLNRGENTWVNINDKTNAMGVYMDTNYSNKITTYGGFNKIGDTIKVSGVFNRACKEHGGDMDIHALNVDILENGKKLEDKVPIYKIVLCFILTIITSILGMIVYKILNKNND